MTWLCLEVFRLLVDVVLSELPSILGTIGTTLGILGGRTPLLLLAAGAVEATVLFLWGRPLILDVGGAGADGANSSFRRRMLSMSTSFPLVSPPSNHSTVTLCSSAFTPEITAEWIRPFDRWMSTSAPTWIPPISRSIL